VHELYESVGQKFSRHQEEHQISNICDHHSVTGVALRSHIVLPEDELFLLVDGAQELEAIGGYKALPSVLQIVVCLEVEAVLFRIP